jgi:hypothetical protein
MKRHQEHHGEEGFHTLCRDVFTRFSSRTKPLHFYELFGYVFQYALSPNILITGINCAFFLTRNKSIEPLLTNGYRLTEKTEKEALNDTS